MIPRYSWFSNNYTRRLPEESPLRFHKIHLKHYEIVILFISRAYYAR